MTTTSFTFTARRNEGNSYSVETDGRTLGRVKLDRAIFSGWIAYRPGAETALLDENGWAAEFETRDEAAAALAEALR